MSEREIEWFESESSCSDFSKVFNKIKEKESTGFARRFSLAEAGISGFEHPGPLEHIEVVDSDGNKKYLESKEYIDNLVNKEIRWWKELIQMSCLPGMYFSVTYEDGFKSKYAIYAFTDRRLTRQRILTHRPEWETTPFTDENLERASGRFSGFPGVCIEKFVLNTHPDEHLGHASFYIDYEPSMFEEFLYENYVSWVAFTTEGMKASIYEALERHNYIRKLEKISDVTLIEDSVPEKTFNIIDP